jgi:tRNA modification GTPase
LNALAGNQQALVHQQAGTTRDWIEVETLVAGWPVCLVDTAGIRSTQDPIEQEGVRRAQSQLDLADLVVLVVDSTVGWTPQHASIAKSLVSQNTTGKCLVVYNKSDLRDIPLQVAPAFLPSVSCSAHHSMDPLLQAMAKLLVPRSPPAGAAIVFTDELSQLAENLLSQLERPAEFWNLERLDYWLDDDRWEVLGS